MLSAARGITGARLVDSLHGVTPNGIAYAVQGSGPPLLWMSGYVVAAASLAEVVRKFADRYTCVTFDHRGSGRSRPPLTPMSTCAMAQDAEGVLRHLGINSAHVYGASLGGMVAQELAIQWPHRVRTLVLGATSAGGIGTESPSVPALLAGFRQAGKAIPGPPHVTVLGAVHQGWAAATHDSTGRLHRIQAPTLVLHGSRDKLLPLSNAQTLARLIPGAELRVIRGAGHLFLFDSQTGAEAVRGWLDAHRTAAARGRPSTLTTALDLAGTPWRLAMAQTLPARRLLGRMTAAPRG